MLSARLFLPFSFLGNMFNTFFMHTKNMYQYRVTNLFKTTFFSDSWDLKTWKFVKISTSIFLFTMTYVYFSTIITNFCFTSSHICFGYEGEIEKSVFFFFFGDGCCYWPDLHSHWRLQCSGKWQALIVWGRLQRTEIRLGCIWNGPDGWIAIWRYLYQ